jgi:hypothetical protein
MRLYAARAVVQSAWGSCVARAAEAQAAPSDECTLLPCGGHMQQRRATDMVVSLRRKCATKSC